jgi:DNA-binding transcriptional regulator WhiA
VPLSEDLRNELAGIAPKRGCDRLAELSGLFHAAGSAHLRGHGEVAVHLDLVSSAVARRAFSLLRALGVESEIRTYRRHAFDRPTRYQLHVEGTGRAVEALTEAGVLGARRVPLDAPPRRVVARACCRGAYLRGALLLSLIHHLTLPTT